MNQHVQIETVLMGFAVIRKALDEINAKLDGKQAALPTEEAVARFRCFLSENRSRNSCRSYSRILSDLEFVYAGRNIPEISASELEEFLRERWGSAKSSTLKQNLVLLQRFFGWCSDYTQYNAMPPFINPCRFINVTDVKPAKRPEFIAPEKMKEFLATASTDRQWLSFAILLVTGMRVSEMIGDPRGGKIGLRKKDVDGRVLTIWDPKSGRKKEYAVITTWISDRLEKYMDGISPEDRVIDVSYASLHGVIKTHGEWIGLKLTPHSLRRWCASWWSRQEEYAMVNFILRHSETKVGNTILISSLGARYVASLSPQEVIEKQDELMKEDLLRGEE